ncbi:hypothetical protein MKW98_016034 [Papaver atlanticum]|uniref:GS catalytic domain-containing protein n=1 Tax=Papaver atlanticum TaxID=357466 RepID=A0AAD4RVD6_9MAGN|nr:hypothetical protein MKW98_016034 [Papaver atlanticum]
MEGKEEWVLFDYTPYSSTQSFDAASPFLQEVNEALQSINITVEQMHAKSGKEVIRAVARNHGLLATFQPKYALNDIGSGYHVHLSLSQNGNNMFMGSNDGSSQYGTSKTAEEFMAGVFGHLSSVLAFVSPHPH